MSCNTPVPVDLHAIIYTGAGQYMLPFNQVGSLPLPFPDEGSCMLPKRWKNTCPFLASANESLVIFLCAYCHLVVGRLCTYYAASHPLTPHVPVRLQISIPDFPETDLEFICVDVYTTKVLSCSRFLSYMECLYISHAHMCKCAVI